MTVSRYSIYRKRGNRFILHLEYKETTHTYNTIRIIDSDSLWMLYAIKEHSITRFLPFSSDIEETGASGVQFIFAAAVSSGENCTFNQDFYQFASADGAKTKPIVAVTGRSFKCSNATVRAWCARVYRVYR